ncbi:MAG: DUF2950 family protein [Planctomycetes bacterium]|nr:DUF2950 family protein [Planctomycetota bacterium]
MNRTCSTIFSILASIFAGCAATEAPRFATPELAMKAIADAGSDQELAERLLGDGGFELLRSGDDVADREDLARVREMIGEKIVFEQLGEDVTVAMLGPDGWEFPIPLLQDEKGWSFDVEAGREEVLARRIGRNELSTIATLRELVLAQREYASVGRDGKPRAFAQKLWSDEGQHDGLYWPTSEAEPPSPVGELLARAAHEGYRRSEEGPVPYHGYHYRLLRAQGAAAPGGAKSFLDAQGHLVAGFAVLAWPATYDNSGVMSFVVSHHGIVFERDLGPDTDARARAIEAYDPGDGWEPCID